MDFLSDRQFFSYQSVLKSFGSEMLVWRSLKEIGLSQKTIDEEDIRFIQYGGLYPKSKPYFALLTLWNYTCAFIFMPAMSVSCLLRGETTVALETTHMTLIVMNMGLQFFVFHYYSGTTTKLYRAIDEKFFDYGDAMDDVTIKCIHQANAMKNRRKKVLGETFKLLSFTSSVGIQIKRPLLYIYNGHGKEAKDGMNWLLYESPSGIYIPYSDHWLPYIFGMVQSYFIVYTVSFAVSSSVTCFLKFAEELLHQLYIIKLGLRNATRRADHLYILKFGKSKKNFRNNAEYEWCLKECLNSSVKHHQIIIELFEDLKRLMYLPLFTVIFDGGALICMSTVEMMTVESVAVKMSISFFMVGELFYTYIYCGYGDRLTLAFSEIGDQLYSEDFLEHSQLMKAYFIITHAHSMRPKRLSAAGFTSANHLSFGNVLRTAYSLMNFMLTQK